LVELVQSRFSGDWAIVFAHRVNGPRGEFFGVVTRATTPASFEQFFASLALGESAAISMYHRDGTLLARYPHIDAMIGKNFATGQMHRQILSRSNHGTMRLSSPLDGLDRLASVRTLAGFPVSIIATTTVAAALADWREQTRSLVVVAGFSVLVIAVMLFFVVRKLSQQHQLEKQRLDTAVNNIPQGLVVYDALARVTVCNRRYIEMFGLSPDVAKPGCTMQGVLRRHHPQCAARESYASDHRGSRRQIDPDHKPTAGSGRVGGHDRGCHGAQTLRAAPDFKALK